MAELVFKIGAGAGYEDGDVLCAFNRKHILQIHAEHICHHWNVPVVRDSLIPLDHVCYDYFVNTFRFRFERIGSKLVLRTDTVTGGVLEIESGKLLPDGTSMSIGEFVSSWAFNRRSNGALNFPMFGSVMRAVWFGGEPIHTDSSIEQVWQAIHAKTSIRNTNDEYQQWPAGQQDLKSHLFIPVNDFSDVEAGDLTKSIMDGADAQSSTIVRKRRMRCTNWRGLLSQIGVNEFAVLDKTVTVDRRAQIQPFADLDLLFDKASLTTRGIKRKS